MFEMPKAQFGRLLSLFDPDEPHSVWVFSTLEGRTLGKAYVDNVDKPMNCLLTLNFTNLICLSDGIDQQWLNQAVAALRQTQEVILNWSPRIAARLQPPAHPEAEKPYFDFHDCHTAHLLPIPEGYHLRTIDHDLFERCLWYDLILSGYGTAENFLRYGFGLCLMSEDEICSEAYAAVLGVGHYDIGIVTHDKYRRQGFAYLTCQHLMQLCEERGFRTYWNCSQSNAGSVATARKLGFRTQRAYQWLYYAQIL